MHITLAKISLCIIQSFHRHTSNFKFSISLRSADLIAPVIVGLTRLRGQGGISVKLYLTLQRKISAVSEILEAIHRISLPSLT